MCGRDADEDSANPKVDPRSGPDDDDWWEPCTGAFPKDKYELPSHHLYSKVNVREQRWELAHRAVSFVKQPGACLKLMVGDREVQVAGVAQVVTQIKPRLPYAANDGLGLYDRRGHPLPQFSLRGGGVVRKNRRNTPIICLRPASSIYLLVEEEAPVHWRRFTRRFPPRPKRQQQRFGKVRVRDERPATSCRTFSSCGYDDRREHYHGVGDPTLKLKTTPSFPRPVRSGYAVTGCKKEGHQWVLAGGWYEPANDTPTTRGTNQNA